MKYLIPLLLISTSAIAQQAGPCDETQKVYNFLINNYGEKPFVEMKDNKDRKMIMFVNPETGTWTVIITDDKIACGVSAGKNFTPADPKRYQEKKKEDPS
jgi:hypothetical protein